MKRLLTISCLLLIANLVTAQQDEQKLMEQINALNKAIFVQKDSSVLAKLLAENATYGHSNGAVELKKEMIHNAMINSSSYQNVRMENASVLVDGNTAIARYELKAKSIDQQGNEGVLSLHVLQTWMKKKGLWLLVARQAVKLP